MISRLCVVFLLLCSSNLNAQSPTNSLPDVINELRASIGRIMVTYKYKSLGSDEIYTSTLVGTGFIIDVQGHIATAGHVVNTALAMEQASQWLIANNKGQLDSKSFLRDSIDIVFEGAGTQSDQNGNQFYDVGDVYSATVLAGDQKVDLAILTCIPNPVGVATKMVINGRPLREPAKVPKLHMAPPRDGDMISVSGFPLSIPVMITNTGWIATAFFKDELNRSLYLGSILVNHGNSGGPAYLDSDGSIIGVVTQYRPAPEGNSGLTVIVPMRSVFELLAKAK